MQTKTCFKCGDRKSLELFYKHPKMADGHLNKCKECTKIDVARVDPEVRAAYERRRSSKPERRKDSMRYMMATRKRYPEKYKARSAVANAIRSGKLIKKPCEKCGVFENIHAHHHDYSKPLDVEWLCRRCHLRGEHGSKYVFDQYHTPTPRAFKP